LTIINAILFFLIALIYSSAGFGGGSMYLAVLGQVSDSVPFVRFTGLSCNAVVTTTGAIHFHIKKWIVWKPLLLLLLCSVPFCVWSSTWRVTSKTYFITLGICLLIAGIFMLIKKRNIENNKVPSRNSWWLLPASMVIGFLSGLTGIGGGVYLSPLLHLSNWGSAKHIAASSSVFILINSIAGLMVQYFFHGDRLQMDAVIFLGAAFTGGLIGSKLSSSVLSQNMVRIITIVLIIFASLRILYRNL